MAVNTFTGATNSNWGTVDNWSLGTVPTANDGHTTTFDAASPACTVNTSARVCNHIDFTNYVNTITMTFTITVSGSIIFGLGMTVDGTAGIIQKAVNTITSNGFSWTNDFTFSGSGSRTLLDNLTILGQTIISNDSGNVTINDFNIYCYGNLTVNQNSTNNRTVLGTTNIHLVGGSDATWTSVGTLKNNLTINKSGGVLTLGANVDYNTGVLTYTAGTVDTTTNDSILYIKLATTLNTDNISWNKIFIIGGAATYNITLNSLLTADIIYLNYYSVSFIGTNVWTCNTFILIGNISAGDFMSLKAGSTYTINTQFRVYSSSVYSFLIKSGTPASVAYLVFNGGSNQKLINCDATDIDSSGGDQIWTLDGLLSNTTNWGVSDSSIPPVIIATSCS